MKASDLHVFCARFNPLRWKIPHSHYLDFVEHMLDSGVNLHVIECQYGERAFECNVSGHIHHVGVRADSWCWSKECLQNLLLARAPEAKYLLFSDSDVFWRRRDWAVETVEALQHYRVVQPWSDCYDLGPGDLHMQHHVSFCRQFAVGQPVGPESWKKPYSFPHPGYAWAMTRAVLDWTGGLFEYGGMGSGDHHMALAFVGRVEDSVPVKGPSSAYLAALKRWQARAQIVVNGRLGYVPGTIEHKFHGSKVNRGYQSRWGMFVKHGFDPETDLKRNTFGVLEFAGNKPALEQDWDRYLRARNEDSSAVQ